jgi:uncharacterized protein (DUF924 family)
LSGGAEPKWVTEILQFWFDELGEETYWFENSVEIDSRIHARFLRRHEWVVANGAAAATTPRSLLAAVIALDQFSRNLFRGTPRAFAADPMARQVSRLAIERDYDGSMNKTERLFLYLPFQHSEDRDDQALAVELIARLGNEQWTEDAIDHKAIIDRFGRFPHRNAILNRESSARELELLQQPRPWF